MFLSNHLKNLMNIQGKATSFLPIKFVAEYYYLKKNSLNIHGKATSFHQSNFCRILFPKNLQVKVESREISELCMAIGIKLRSESFVTFEAEYLIENQ